jgi:hypothetical protein
MSTHQAVLVALTLFTGACSAYGGKGKASPGKDQSAIKQPAPLTDLQVAEAWLQCIDCRGPFLVRLYAAPGARRDTLVGFFSASLALGPDSERKVRLVRDLKRIWYADSVYAVRRGKPLRVTGAAFLRRYQEGFEVNWRSRAATALGVLRGDSALAALRRATDGRFDSSLAGHRVILAAVHQARADTGRIILRARP